MSRQNGKSYFLHSLIIVYNFSIFAQSCSINLLTSAKIWKLVAIFFKKPSCCTTTVPNVLFLTYPNPEILAAGEYDLPTYTDPKKV